MAGFTKWIGGGLGWVFGGPIGGLLGFALGAVIDSVEVKKIGARPTTAGRSCPTSYAAPPKPKSPTRGHRRIAGPPVPAWDCDGCPRPRRV